MESSRLVHLEKLLVRSWKAYWKKSGDRSYSSPGGGCPYRFIIVKELPRSADGDLCAVGLLISKKEIRNGTTAT